MAATLEELEKRLTAVERDMALMRQFLVHRPPHGTAAERGARLLREARANHPAASAAVAEAFAEMGITGEPIGAEKVQELVAACGIRPEDNEFSRGIIDMREE